MAPCVVGRKGLQRAEMNAVHDIAKAVAADIKLDAVMPGESGQPRHLDDVLKRLAVPAVSVAAIRAGEVDWAEAWGMSDRERAATASARTLFQAGSISKPVAALVALRLVASGALDLDEPVREKLVSWQVPANDGWEARLTVRHLLSHTSGLTVHGFPGYPSGAAVPSLPDVLSGRGNTAPVRVRTIPGFQYSYSGGGYTVLQQLLIDVTGSSFPELARELVFEDLEMSDSTYEQPLPRELWHQAASGHRTGGAPVAGRWHLYPEMAAAGLWTTPTDLAKFIVAVRRTRHRGGILPVELATEMLTRQAPNFPVGLGIKFDAGIGPAFRGAGTERAFGHGGDDQGFLAIMIVYDVSGDGAVVMSNSDDGGAVVIAVLEAMARAYRWAGRPVAEHDPPSRTEVDALAGSYRFEDGTRAELVADDRELHLTLGGQQPIRFTEAEPGRWDADAVEATIFVHGGTGDDRPSFVLHQEAMYVRYAVVRRV
jgi:CubicO group peptidase (beta-lactamase class C family)